ncbi:MAG: ABC transporter permease [Agathobacter sp.]
MKNIFFQYAAKSLKKNKTRTLVTIVGIILSTAMLTAVTTIISSVQAYGIAFEEQKTGDWHVSIRSMDRNQKEELEKDSRVSLVYELENIGYANLEESVNAYKPYLCIQGMSQSFADHMPIHLTEGRMPETETELIIPEHVEENAGVTFSLGETLTLSVGERENENGEVLWQDNPLFVAEEEKDSTGNDQVKKMEHLAETEQKTYTIVGFYERPDFENYSAPGYTALTLASSADNSCYDGYAVMKHPHQAIGLWEEWTEKGTFTDCNNSLLRFYGVSVRSDFNSLIYGMGGILMVIIVFGSIALIYNAFAISISERTKQFGLFASTGATRRQMKQTIRMEALILCVIGVPIGILSGICGIGITISFFADSMQYLIGADSGLKFKLSVSVAAVVVAAIVGIVTVLVSAWLPMRRALKLSPIEAIRQKNDVRLTKKQVKMPGWVNKCFGLTGMIAWKNFKRNKKRYRSTIVSLVLSILLFVSAGCFSDYFFGGFMRATETSEYDVQVMFFDDEYENVEKGMKLAESAPGSNLNYQCIYNEASVIWVDKKDLTDAGKKQALEEQEVSGVSDQRESDMVSIPCCIQFLPEQVYEDLIQFYGLDREKYLGETFPKAIVLNNIADNSSEKQEALPVLTSSCREFTMPDGGEKIQIGDLVENTPGWDAEFSDQCIVWPGGNYQIQILYPLTAKELLQGRYVQGYMFLNAEDHATVTKWLEENVEGNVTVYDAAEDEVQQRMLLMMLNVFSLGFIILISLITAANVFNTISTNMGLRRREFAMLKSVGMTPKEFKQMLNFECLIYGTKSLLYGFLVTIPVVLFMYYLGHEESLSGFYLPWRYVVISVLCVFAVVYATMIYAQTKGRKEDIAEALKEND